MISVHSSGQPSKKITTWARIMNCTGVMSSDKTHWLISSCPPSSANAAEKMLEPTNNQQTMALVFAVRYTDSRKTMPSMTLKQAIDAFGKKRTERTRNEELAVNAGKAKFRYHISRPEKSDGKKPAVKFTPAQRQACDNALASFPATKLADQIKMLRAYLTSLEAQ